MHLSHIPQCSIRNRNAHISVLNGALWDMEQVNSGICEIVLVCHLASENTQWKLLITKRDQRSCLLTTAVTPRFNTLRPRQDGRYLADDGLKCIFLNENVWISLKIPLKFVARGPINNIPAFGQIMAWRRPGDRPLSEPMRVCLLTHICVTRTQWVN